MGPTKSFGFFKDFSEASNTGQDKSERSVLDLEVEYIEPAPSDELLLGEEFLADDSCLPAPVTPEDAQPGNPCVKVFVGSRGLSPPQWGSPGQASNTTGREGGLAGQLAEARRLVGDVHRAEERSHEMLYRTIGCAYDFMLTARSAPSEFAQLLLDTELKMQERAPMIPVVKLVFGVHYDKTRLTEYATVLDHGLRLRLQRGSMAKFLLGAPGGLKGVVAEERRIRRLERGKALPERTALPGSLAQGLRALPTRQIEELSAEGDEFVLVMARRTADGTVAVIGEAPNNLAMLEKTARHLLKQQ